MSDRPCCSVGARPDAEVINAALAKVGQEGAESLSSISARIGVNKGVVYKHRVKCLGLGAVGATEAHQETAPETPKRTQKRSEKQAETPGKRQETAERQNGPPSPRNAGAIRTGSGRRCTVCDHPDRPAIDEALVGAAMSLRSIEARYDLTHGSAVRHSQNHIPALLAMAHEGEVVTAAESLLEVVPELIERGHRMFGEAEDILTQAKEVRDLEVAIKAIRAANDSIGRLVSAAELLGKVTGELKDKTTVNILLAPQFVAFQQRVVAVVSRHPEAAAELSAELAMLEAAPG